MPAATFDSLRRGLTRLLLLFLLIFAHATAHASPRGGTLHVLTFEESFAKHTLADFRVSTGIAVQVHTYQSSEELLVMLEHGLGAYDLMIVADYMIPILRERGLIESIDKGQLPNFRQLNPRFLDLSFDGGNQYSLPYLWGTTGFAYRADLMKARPKTWDAALDPEAPWAQDILLLEDMREAIGAALRAQDASANSQNAAEIAQTKSLLLRTGNGALTFDSAGYTGQLAFGTALLAQAWSDDIAQLRARGYRQIQYVLPQDGGSLWMDVICMAKATPKAEAAHRFMNYLMNPRTAAAISNARRRPTAVWGALKFIEPEILNDPAIYPLGRALKNSEFLHDLGGATAHYDALWLDILWQNPGESSP